MKRLLTTALLAAAMCVSSQAAIVTFELVAANTGSNFTSPITFAGSGSENGVNFLSAVDLSALVGSSLVVDNNGTGVVGTGSTSFEINSGEVVNFAPATVSSITGGTAVFTGFTSISFSEFDPGDTGTVNGQLIDSDGTVALTGSPTSLILAGTGDAPPADDGFQVTQVTANFTVTASAVPEPSSLATLLLIGGCGVMRRRRK